MELKQERSLQAQKVTMKEQNRVNRMFQDVIKIIRTVKCYCEMWIFDFEICTIKLFYQQMLQLKMKYFGNQICFVNVFLNSGLFVCLYYNFQAVKSDVPDQFFSKSEELEILGKTILGRWQYKINFLLTTYEWLLVISLDSIVSWEILLNNTHRTTYNDQRLRFLQNFPMLYQSPLYSRITAHFTDWNPIYLVISCVNFSLTPAKCSGFLECQTRAG